MSTESMMPSNHIIPCCPLLCLLSIFPSTNESALHIRWPKYWSFSFSISPSNDYSGLTSLEEVWSPYRPRDSQRVFSNTTVQKYQFFNAQPSLWSMTSLWYMTTEKTIALNLWIFVDKMMSPGGSAVKNIWMWELEGWAPKNWCFWPVVLEKTLESPLDCKEIQPVHPKRDQSWMSIGRTDA